MFVNLKDKLINFDIKLRPDKYFRQETNIAVANDADIQTIVEVMQIYKQ